MKTVNFRFVREITGEGSLLIGIENVTVFADGTVDMAAFFITPLSSDICKEEMGKFKSGRFYYDPGVLFQKNNLSLEGIREFIIHIVAYEKVLEFLRSIETSDFFDDVFKSLDISKCVENQAEALTENKIHFPEIELKGSNNDVVDFFKKYGYERI